MPAIGALLDAANQSAQLRDFVGLGPGIRDKQKHQNDQACGQRLQIRGNRLAGGPGNCREAHGQGAKQQQSGTPDASLAAAQLITV
jgi:hypothetical protein